MPEPFQDFISTLIPAATAAGLEPVQNAIESLTLLAKTDTLSGLGDWVASTWAAMPPEERETHSLVMWGFYYAFFPERSWPSFPAYLDYLEGLPPEELRNRLLDAYARIPLLNEGKENGSVLDLEAARDEMLRSFPHYLAFLRKRFCEEGVVVEIEKQAYEYVHHPQAMHRLIVTHLRRMWDRFLAEEWQRVLPMLEDAVRASQSIDFAGIDRLEAARLITGQEPEEKLRASIQEAGKLIFVPNAHIGPYLHKLRSGEMLWLIYGARLPRGVSIEAPDLSRAEILVRLGALTDDGRLRILRLIAERGEMRSAEVMQALEMSQPTASRHLTQLTATGYLAERRCDGAKCYALNPARIEETLQAIKAYLIPASRRPRLARRVG